MPKKADLEEKLLTPISNEEYIYSLLNLKNINAKTVNVITDNIRFQLHGNPFSLAIVFNPSDELLQRAKYFTLVASHENARYARGLLAELIHYRALTLINPVRNMALDFEKEVLTNHDLHTHYVETARSVSHAIHLNTGIANEDSSYEAFQEKLKFKNELKDYLDFFFDHERDIPSTLFKMLKLSEFLTKKFPHLTHAKIKAEVKRFFAEFARENKPFATALILAGDALENAEHELAGNKDKKIKSALADLKFGLDCVNALVLSDYDLDKELHAEIEPAAKARVLTVATKFLVEDLIPNSSIRRELDDDLAEIKKFGVNKLKSSKDNDLLSKDQAAVTIELSKNLSVLSDNYFRAALKTDAIKTAFKSNSENEITKATEVLGKTAPLKWKSLMKKVLFTISVVATAGLTLAVKAAHQKVTTGRVSLFKNSSKSKAKKKLNAIKRKITSAHFRTKVDENDKNKVEMSRSKRSKH